MTEPIRWTKTALEARVEALEQRHSGQQLIDAIVDFADTLTEADRRLLQDVLLKRRRPAMLRIPRRREPPSED